MSKYENPHGKENKEPEKGVSPYSHVIDILDTDPLEEIFELNLGDFLCEHLINPDLADRISQNVKDKNENLKNQLRELISIYSIDNTLAILGFNKQEERILYNSIAQTIESILSLKYCNIYIAKKGEDLKLSGTSLEGKSAGIPEKVKECYGKQEKIELHENDTEILIFPMKNNYECIGAIEVARDIKRPLEEGYQDLIKITARLFVTSLGLQKLIDEVQKATNAEVFATGELQNLRAQLTVVIGDLGDQQQAFVETMARAVDLKGKHDTNHSQRTAELARDICAYMKLNEKTTDLIYYAALLQNIGQIHLSDELFNKKEKLTKEEWEALQNHPNAGVSLLMNINFMSEVIPYIHYQKERWDGQGRPEGLGGQSIPFGSRIIALADAYCALMENRPHRKALSKEDALEIIRQESGIKWDPALVQALLEIE